MTENEPTNEQPNEPVEEIIVVEETVTIEELFEPTADTATDTAAVDAAVARTEADLSAAEAVATEVTMVEGDATVTLPTEQPAAVPSVPEAAEPVVAAAVAADATAGWGGAEPAPAPGFTPAEAQPVYVAAPIPPKPKSNRLFATLISLLGTAIFAALYAGGTYIYLSVNQQARHFVDFLESPIFWGAAIVFFIGYMLLGIIINRGPWWTHAVFSLLVAVLVYFGVVAATLVAVRVWNLTAAEASEFLRQQWLSPYALMAAVIAREVPIWLGGWVSSHGRKVTARNEAALDAYDREVAASPLFS
ncbi:MAG: hypothetical protein ACOYBP_04310 [Microbacteriaceae bacterium]